MQHNRTHQNTLGLSLTHHLWSGIIWWLVKHRVQAWEKVNFYCGVWKVSQVTGIPVYWRRRRIAVLAALRTCQHLHQYIEKVVDLHILELHCHTCFRENWSASTSQARGSKKSKAAKELNLTSENICVRPPQNSTRRTVGVQVAYPENCVDLVGWSHSTSTSPVEDRKTSNEDVEWCNLVWDFLAIQDIKLGSQEPANHPSADDDKGRESIRPVNGPANARCPSLPSH